jgi:hypothetical protein
MKTKSILPILPLFIVGVFIALSYGCKKDKDEIVPIGKVPLLTTSVVSDVTGTKAVCGGDIADDGGLTVTARGVCWSTSPSVTISNSKTVDGAGAGVFSSAIRGLKPFTTYFVRAYATNSAGTAYGSAMSFTTKDLEVGDDFQGGIIAYYFVSGDPGYVSGEKHGLIIAPVNQSDGIQWYNGTNISTGASSFVIGSGNPNTNLIVSVQGAGDYAAKLCYDLELGGYSDWYLPGYVELQKAYTNRTKIGGLDKKLYWSSTEQSSGIASSLDFSTSAMVSSPKNSLCYVRAFRNF